MDENLTPLEDPVVERMVALVQAWDEAGDHKAIFLRCYMMMTRNMHTALARGEFDDPAWVNQLLHRFANYYFVALDAYQDAPTSAPAVWQLAHNLALETRLTPLQKLLLGVNAHINHDLVFTLVDLLEPEWQALTPDQRTRRYSDHCHVNDVIGQTIDAVQDQVLEPSMPLLKLFDVLLGPVDEFLISRLISGWREDVWQHATGLLATSPVHTQLAGQVEAHALRLGKMIARLGR